MNEGIWITYLSLIQIVEVDNYLNNILKCPLFELLTTAATIANHQCHGRLSKCLWPKLGKEHGHSRSRLHVIVFRNMFEINHSQLIHYKILEKLVTSIQWNTGSIFVEKHCNRRQLQIRSNHCVEVPSSILVYHLSKHA